MTFWSLTKSGDDYFGREPLADPRAPSGEHVTRWKAELSEISFVRHNSLEVPGSGVLRLVVSLSDGTEMETWYEWSREFLPLSQAEDLPSILSGLPSTAEVVDRDRPGIVYRIENGVLVPVVEVEVVKAITAAVRRYRTEKRAVQVEEIAEKGLISKRAYCGLYCVFGALLMNRIDIDIVELMRPEYIGSFEGSSLVELEAAVTDSGGHAATLSNLTIADLRREDRPTILHVRRSVRSEEFDHYLLLLEVTGESAIVMDTPTKDHVQPVYELPLRELIPRWGGVGMVVDSAPIDLLAIRSRAAARSIVLLGVLAIGLFGAAMARSYVMRHSIAAFKGLKRVPRWGVDAGVIIAICGAMAVAYHSIARDGLLARSPTATLIADRYRVHQLPEVDYEQAASIWTAGSAVFVDARDPEIYSAGTIEGAINLPAGSDAETRKRTMQAIDQDSPIVVFCQGPECPYAEMVAADLIRWGFRDVRIFSGGWESWTEGHREAVESPPAGSSR